MIIPSTYDLTIYQGATLNQQFVWKSSDGTPINLTGMTARMQVRPAIDSGDVLVDLTTENGGIVLGGALGTITLNYSAADTADLSFKFAVYDLEIINVGVVSRLLQGKCTLSPEVTKS